MIRRGFVPFGASVALLAAALPALAAPAPGQALVVVPACRAVDTRLPAGLLGGPALSANEIRLLPVAGTCGVPANALGLAVNLTVVAPAAVGFAQLYAGDAPRPGTSVLNFVAGQTRANNAFVSLAGDGSGTFALANASGGAAHYVVDVVGYFRPACTGTLAVTNPATSTGTVNAPFSQSFTASGAVGTATFSTASPLPTGLTLSASGALSGTPTQSGTFPITVTATDANGCTAAGPTYNLVISCQTISVTNPSVSTGTANAPFSQTFTSSGGVGAVTFSTSSALPIGLTLSSAGVLSGTPTQAGGFDIVVTATDANGCTGSGATYHLVVNCQTIAVTNPATATGTAGTAFSQTFTQAGAIGTATFSLASGALPTGLTLAANGTLSGTPTVVGAFPVTVKVTDGNLCTGTGATYNLAIGCGTITVTNPATSTATAGAAFSQTFTQAGSVGSATFTTASTLPAGLTLAANGTLSGTPTQTGSFAIVVKVTDANGCTGTGGTYNLLVGCQSWSVGPATIPQGTTGVPYPSVTFTAAGGIGAVSFSETGTLPVGMSFAAGVLSGTPAQTGSFPITVTATDANGCTASRDYLLVVVCSGSSITLSPSALPTVVSGSAFPPTTFTASGGTGPYTMAKAGALPAGMSFAADTLSGTPTQTGTFPITISATDSGGCAGSQDYVVTVTCNGVTITVAPPSLTSGPVGTAYGPVTFSASGGTSPYTLANVGALPPGMAFAGGVLSGTPTQPGTFPVVVTATDAAGCTGATSYSLVTTCPTITVTNPSTATGTVDAAFSQTFTQTGAAGTATFTTASTLPAGLTLSSAGVLSGTPGEPGTFPIVVKVTDANGCTGTSATYTLIVSCQTITVSNPATATGTVDAAFSQSFTQSGVGTHTPGTFTTASTLPAGLTLSTAGLLSGTPAAPGTFDITVTVTDANGCSGTSANYHLVIACQTISVTNPSATASTYNTALSPAASFTFTQSGVGTHTPVTFTVASGTLPTGVTLSSAGVLSGAPTQTGTFTITVKATDANGCFGTSGSYTLTVAPVAAADSYSGLVDNTQFVVTGGATGSPSTPFVGATGRLTTNDLPSGSVSLTAGTFATTAGGSVTIASDGTFVYTPKANPTLAAVTSDSFTYTISSNTGGTPTAATANGTVTLTLGGRVWYVKNNGLAGNGQSQSPFQTLAAAASASVAGDVLYVYFGDGTTANQNAGIALKNSQVLTGEGVALVVNSATLRAAGSSPSITNTSGNVVTLANGNTIQGLTLTGSANALVAGGSGVTGTTSLNTVVMTPSGTASGVSLTSQAAGHTFNYNSGSITSASSGAAVLMSGAGGAGPATFAVAISSSSGKPIDISSRTGGTVAFNGAVSGTGQGISLTNNTGSTISFTGGISLSTGTSAAFTATGGGTVTATQNNTTIVNTLATTTGTALNVASTTIGAAGLTFRSISANGAANGIVLNTTGASGGLTVAGNAGTCTLAAPTCSGGTIQNTTGDGVVLTSTRANLSLMRIRNSFYNGIDATSLTAFVLTDVLLDGNTTCGAPCLGGLNGSPGGFSPAGLLLTNLASTSGNTVTRLEVTGSTEDNVRVRNDSGATGTITFDACKVHDNSTASGNMGIFVQTVNTGVLTATVQNSTFQGNRTIALRGDAGDSSTLTVTFTGNTIVAGSPNQGNQGIEVAKAITSNVTFTIDANKVGTPDGTTSQPLINTGINVFSGSSAGTMSGTVTNNVVLQDLASSNPGSGIVVNHSPTSTSSTSALYARVHGNTVGGSQLNYGIQIDSGGIANATGNTQVQLTNNTVLANMGAGALDSIRVGARRATTACYRISGNTATTAGAGFFSMFLRKADTSTYRIEGLASGLQSDATTIAYEGTQNPGIGGPGIGATAGNLYTGVAAGTCNQIP